MTGIVVVFFVALALSLALTPVVRAFCLRTGMVDKPDKRRINKTPIPRGGGLAVVFSLLVTCAVAQFSGLGVFAGRDGAMFVRMCVLALAMAAIGFADDWRSLRPKVKLACQLVVASAVWWWAGLGFRSIFPFLPAVLDFGITVFWIVGAVNAFNLIDGLDGLASGIAFIASIAMAGALWFSGCGTEQILFHFAFAGALLGFLRYNYNPASVFLGDSGSMFIGFTVSAMPLMFNAPNSFLVSVGVPLLAMGVPMFDTVLAILRRSLRHLLKLRDGGETANDKVMAPDSDHLHHRIFRAEGFNQRKAAWMLYLATAVAVGFGLVAMALKSRSAGLWLVAVACAAAVVFKSLSHIELFDAGRLLDEVAHDRRAPVRRRLARLSVPFYVFFDVAVMVGVFFILSAGFSAVAGGEIPARRLWQICLVRSAICFAAVATFGGYSTVWSRAMAGNFARLFAGCAAGSVVSGAVVFYVFDLDATAAFAFTAAYALSVFFLLSVLRATRPAIRDLFYSISSQRLRERKDVSRVLVYGCGLRYRAFRRELVRSAAANTRIIVGLLDDDFLLKGHYVGNLKVLGGINEAPEIINAVNADTVVIACEIEEEWLKVVMDILRPTKVRVTHFGFHETEVQA